MLQNNYGGKVGKLKHLNLDGYLEMLYAVIIMATMQTREEEVV